jgi:hypothetical protein
MKTKIFTCLVFPSFLTFLISSCNNSTQNQELDPEKLNENIKLVEEEVKPQLTEEMVSVLSHFTTSQEPSSLLYPSGKKTALKKVKGLLQHVLKKSNCDLMQPNYEFAGYYKHNDGTHFIAILAEGGDDDMTPAGPPQCAHVFALNDKGEILNDFMAEFGLAGGAMTQVRTNTQFSINKSGQLERIIDEGETSYYNNYSRGTRTTYQWVDKNWKKTGSKKYDEKFVDEE